MTYKPVTRLPVHTKLNLGRRFNEPNPLTLLSISRPFILPPSVLLHGGATCQNFLSSLNNQIAVQAVSPSMGGAICLNHVSSNCNIVRFGHDHCEAEFQLA